MHINAPRWLLILEGMLLLVSLAVLAYKAATRVLPLPVDKIEQQRSYKKPDYQTQILKNYTQYPDRYLRIIDERWTYDPGTQAAYHSFSLRNIATLGYTDIEVSFTYEGPDGKELLKRTAKIPGVLAASKTTEVKRLKISGVPRSVSNVVTSVSKAAIVR